MLRDPIRARAHCQRVTTTIAQDVIVARTVKNHTSRENTFSVLHVEILSSSESADGRCNKHFIEAITRIYTEAATLVFLASRREFISDTSRI